MNDITLPDTTMLSSSLETGTLGIMHLKRFLEKKLLTRQNSSFGKDLNNEWQVDKTLLSVLNLGLEQCLTYIFREAPTFEGFENWIRETAGEPDPVDVGRFNNLFLKNKVSIDEPVPAFLTEEQLSFWDRNGYLIIKNAVPKKDCDEVIKALCDFIGIERENPETWYNSNPARQGIMVQMFQHPVLSKNRRSSKIRMAFEQLWQRKDLWVTADRVGFNPPETKDWKFPGPDLHWDCSLDLPISFGTQGILYLADTTANQGAFTLVPGFQNMIENWLHSLPAGTNPREENLHALGSLPIVADAGDFILWHQALPHGSSRNTSDKPRFVQYINYEPVDIKEAFVWK